MRRKVLKLQAALLVVIGIASYAAQAQDIPTIRFGRQTAAEDNLWLMLAKPELAPNLNKAYKVEWTQLRASEAAFKAFEGGQIDLASSAGNAVIAAAAVGAGVEDHRHAQPGNRTGRCEHQVSREEGWPEQDRRPEGRNDRHHRLSQRGRAVGARRR